MKSEWKKVPIKDLCIGIYDGPHATPPKSDSGAIFLGIPNFSNGRLDLSNIRHISENDLPRWTKRVTPQAHDIVFSYEATLNLYAIIPEGFRGCLGRRMALMRPDESKVNYKFLYYYMFSCEWREEIERHKVIGSTVDRIPLVSFPSFIVSLPDMATQRFIADTLSALDDKIELNNKINDNLEQQAQTIFRKMFLEDTQRRKVTIRDVVANVTDGVHNTVKDDPEGHYFLLSCKNIKGGKITLGNSERKINEETFEKLRKRTRLEKGDVLLSSVGTIGELVLLKEDPFCYEFQRSVAMIKPNREIVSPEYLYEALLTQRLEIIHAAHGAVQQCVFISDIYDFIIPLPTQKELSKFDSMVVPMFDKIQQNEHEIRCLTNLRDALLLKLMNGELKAYLVR